MRQTCETDRPDRVADLFADFALRGVDDRLTFLDLHLPFSRLRAKCLHLVSRFVRPEQE